MSNVTNHNPVHGYKVFKADWTCSPAGNTKQYACPAGSKRYGDFHFHYANMACISVSDY